MTVDDVSQAVSSLAAQGVFIDLATLRREVAKRRLAIGAATSLHVTDLALAWACQQNDEGAIRLFERAYFSHAARALKRMRLSATLTDDVLGWMRFELFARPQGGLIATYSGRGDLGSWVRSIAVHEALKRAKRERRDVTPDAAAELPMPEPEFAAMRGAYGVEFTRALDQAFRALTTEQRNLLRHYFLDGLTIDMLAGLYKIHRATAARRVATARTELVEHVRRVLKRDLEMSESGIDDVITLSNLRESLGQLLRKTR